VHIQRTPQIYFPYTKYSISFIECKYLNFYFWIKVASKGLVRLPIGMDVKIVGEYSDRIGVKQPRTCQLVLLESIRGLLSYRVDIVV